VWRGDATDNTQIEVYWAALTAPENGDSEVQSYNVQWDQGPDGTFVELVGETSSWLGLSHIADGLDEGGSYDFRIRARNKWGWGAYSATRTVRCATVPAQPAMVTTAVDPAEGGFQITWVAPAGRGEAVTNYTVQVWSKTADDGNGDWVLSLETCDGVDATVLASCDPATLECSCIIPMATITADFGYALGELVQARVAASNWVGISAYSEANESGEGARTVPLPPLAPTEGAATTENELQVDWLPVTGTDTGNSPVLSYSLWWDNGAGGEPTTERLEEDVLTEYITGLTPGGYRFMVRANNVYGYGEWSPVAEIRASNVPDVLAALTVTLNYPYFDFAWAEPLTGHEVVDAYEILIYSPTTGTYYEDKDYCDGDDGGAQETGRIC